MFESIKTSGRHASVGGTDLRALRCIVMPLAFNTDVGVDDVDVALGNRAYGTFRHADTACHAILCNF